MTLSEIQMVMKAYEEQLKWEATNTQNSIYTTAYLTATFVGSIFNGKQPPGIEEVFPTEENIEQAQKAKIAHLKQQFQNFSIMHNATRKES